MSSTPAPSLEEVAEKYFGKIAEYRTAYSTEVKSSKVIGATQKEQGGTQEIITVLSLENGDDVALEAAYFSTKSLSAMACESSRIASAISSSDEAIA